ncbi:hypothetical protein K7R23_24665 [Citrobacter rodentium NBRC 105723 = DSM 16636]|jgi:hypothetical protein|uniref:hypothetical protein n=1 Tax=Citrobacter rodentium TaxID=67825 RepID=UPI001364C2B8|nr:hypothetical protein [Citrobacter rodentium]UHO31069.1 hypothetical protein K7R23_24665 [Citrobacter rodentium NBRC 105723 = DSM 16636]
MTKQEGEKELLNSEVERLKADDGRLLAELSEKATELQQLRKQTVSMEATKPN